MEIDADPEPTAAVDDATGPVAAVIDTTGPVGDATDTGAGIDTDMTIDTVAADLDEIEAALADLDQRRDGA